MKKLLTLILALVLFVGMGAWMAGTQSWPLRILILAIGVPGLIWLSRLDARRKGSEAEQAKGGDRRFTALFLLRVVGVLVLGLLVAMAFRDLFQGLDTNFASNLTAIIGLSAFILVVGPFWPSQEEPR